MIVSGRNRWRGPSVHVNPKLLMQSKQPGRLSCSLTGLGTSVDYIHSSLPVSTAKGEMSTERKEFYRLTVEVRAFFSPIDLLWLGQKHHLCKASQPHSFLPLQTTACAAWQLALWEARRWNAASVFCFSLQGKEATTCRVTSHFAASLTFISNLSDRGTSRDRVILCLELLPRQVWGCSPESDLHRKQLHAPGSARSRWPQWVGSEPGPRPGPSTAWRGESLRYHSQRIISVLGSSRCHGNFQRSSLSLVFSSTVGD